MSMAVSAEQGRARPFRISLKHRVRFGRVAFGIFLLLIWHFLALSSGPDVIAAPLDVASRIGELLRSSKFYVHLRTTFTEAAVGLLIGTAVGVALPLLLRLSDRLTLAMLPYIRGAMGIPKLALAPLFIIWFGFGVESKIALVILIVFIMVFEGAFAGVNSVDRRLVVMAKILNASEAQVTRKVVLKSIMPFIFAALKTAVPFAFNAAIVGEFLSSQTGLGNMITTAMGMGDVTGVFAGVTIVATITVLLDAGLSRVRGRSLAWQTVDKRAVAQ